MIRISVTTLRWLVIAFSIAWIAGFGWMQFSSVVDDFGLRSSSYARSASECHGSYNSRYDCKSSLLIAGENGAFLDWMMRLAIVFGPPTLAGLLLRTMRRRRDAQAAEAARLRSIERARARRAGPSGLGIR